MPLAPGFKPMLAGKVDVDHLRYPVLASPKLDGVRAIVVDGRVLSRSLKEIPNAYVQECFGSPFLEGLDGELIVGPPNAKNAYNATVSGVMSYEGRPDVTFHIFDHIGFPRHEYIKRYDLLVASVRNVMVPTVLVEQKKIHNGMELYEYESQKLALGYEGIMIRSFGGAYKYGRSTLNEGYLLKMKRFEDGEAKIVGFEELMHNANEAKTNALGHSERSSHKENKVPMNTLGALIVKDCKSSVEFNIGTGFSEVQRQRMWENRSSLIGELVKYKFQPAGVLEKPRFPTFIGLRDRRDM